MGFISLVEFHKEEIPKGYSPCVTIYIPLSTSCLRESIEHARKKNGAVLWNKITLRLKNSGIRAIMMPRDCKNVGEIAKATRLWINGQYYKKKEVVSVTLIRAHDETKSKEIARWKAIFAHRNGNRREIPVRLEVKTLLLPNEVRAVG